MISFVVLCFVFCVLCFVFCVSLKKTKAVLQDVDVSAATGDEEGSLQGPDHFVRHDVGGEEGHQVVGKANSVDPPQNKSCQHRTSQVSVTAIEELKKEGRRKRKKK